MYLPFLQTKFIQGNFIEFINLKLLKMLEVYREVMRDVSQNFEGSGNFIKQEIEEICEWRDIFCFLVL